MVAHVQNQDYWVVSEQYDLFPVTLRVPEVFQIRLLPATRELPPGIDEGDCDLVQTDGATGFFDEAELEQFEAEARSLMGVDPPG